MKRAAMIGGALVLAIVAGGQSRPPSGARAPESPRQAPGGADAERILSELGERDAGAVLDDFHDAASRADFDRFFSHWTGASVFLGTDATERWVGDEFKAFAKPHFDKGKGWTYHPHDRHITMAPDGEHAFFDELLDNDKLGLCRGSGVLRKSGDDWKIMQYNLSIPVPNEAAEKVVGIIRAEKPPAPATEEKHKE